MPQKRRIVPTLIEPTTKRRTRSSGPLPEGVHRNTLLSETGPMTPYRKRKAKESGSFKENRTKDKQQEQQEDSSEDELILLPSKLYKQASQVTPSHSPQKASAPPAVQYYMERSQISSGNDQALRKRPRLGEREREMDRGHDVDSLFGSGEESPSNPNDELVQNTLNPYDSSPTSGRRSSRIKKDRGRCTDDSGDLLSTASPIKKNRRATQSKRKANHSDSPPPSPTKKQKTLYHRKNDTIPSSLINSVSNNTANSSVQLSPTQNLKFDSVVMPLLSGPRSPLPSLSVIPADTARSVLPLPTGSPTNVVPIIPHTPSKKCKSTFSSSNSLPHTLPTHLHSCFIAQKKAILCALQRPPDIIDDREGEYQDEEKTPTNSATFEQLTHLLTGTITRGEGNSCLLLGPRGSGKTRITERCISNFSGENLLILRLSGWIQHSDRLAMREIAYQLGQQTGTPFLSHNEDAPPDLDLDATDEDINPFLDTSASANISLPPSSHLPALISVLPTLARPIVVILDGFDLFALHPRQSLLYCLLDTVQSCRATVGSKGLAVIGITSRVDTINTLEKRVKSRFSGRILRSAPPRRVRNWEKMVRAIMSSDIDEHMRGSVEANAIMEWKALWQTAVNKFLEDEVVQATLNETFSVTQEVRMLIRILLSTVLQLSPTSPYPSSSQLTSAAVAQRARPRFPFLHTLPYPSMCLLIASIHADTAGYNVFTFEMLYGYFRDQVRASTSAPIQINGGSIGMVRCSRQVLMTAFENLVACKVFISTTAFTPSTAKEFVKYRSIVDKNEVKKAVDKMGQINLKKWFNKAQ